VHSIPVDKNQIDRFYLPETFVPNIKLFPKGNKSNGISYPNTMERTLKGFLHFLEQYTGLNLTANIEAQAPEYLNQDVIRHLFIQLSSAINRCQGKHNLSKDTDFRFHFAKPIPFLKQFLAMYFSDPKCFHVEYGTDREGLAVGGPAGPDGVDHGIAGLGQGEPAARVRGEDAGAHEGERLGDGAAVGGEASESVVKTEAADMHDQHIKKMINTAVTIVRDELKYTQPDDPEKYLANQLQKIPIVLDNPWTRCVPCNRDPKLWIEAASAIKTLNNDLLKSILNDQGLIPFRDFQCRSIEDSLVCLACGYGNKMALELLFDYGANMNELIILEGNVSMGPIEVAVSIGHENVVLALLMKGVPFRNSLAIAAEKGDVGLVRLLLENNSHPDIASNGITPLILAVKNQHDSVIHALVKYKAAVHFDLDIDICRKTSLGPKSTLLHYAAKLGFTSSVQAILDVWPEGKVKLNQAGKMPIELAPVGVKCYLDERYLDTLCALRGLAIGGKDSSATLTFLEGIVKDVKDVKGADVNAQDVRGWTPLMAAALSDDEKCCEFLLKHGAKLSTQGRLGFTAYFWAKAANSERVIKLFEDMGMGLSDKEQQGLKRLKSGRESGSEEVCSLLKISKDTGIILSAPSIEQLDKRYSTIIERIMESAEKIEHLARAVLPANYTPRKALEESILALDEYEYDEPKKKFPVVEKCHQERPGEGDFPNWRSLVQHSKVFVQVRDCQLCVASIVMYIVSQVFSECFYVIQERVASGDCLHPPYIFALHLYTVPCNLFYYCCKYMRERKSKELEPFQDFIWYLWSALERLPVRSQWVYRGLYNVNPSEILRNYRGKIVWPAFSSTSFSKEVRA
jgi:uncharacterized protein